MTRMTETHGDDGNDESVTEPKVWGFWYGRWDTDGHLSDQ